MGSGIYSAKSFIADAPYSGQEAQIHSYLATAGGLFLTLGMLLNILTDKTNSFFAMPTIRGLLQRLFWIVGFAWLAYLGDGGA